MGLLVVAAWGWHRVEMARVANTLPTRDGLVRVSGLEGVATILRDGRGTPHVRADHFSDAVFALGFVHAQDRLAQMEWMRRGAYGRSAEWVGERGVAADRLARTLGLGRLAIAEAERLDSDTKRLLEAYSAGVNARASRTAPEWLGADPGCLAGPVDR